MKKFLAILVALLCASTIPFAACVDGVDTGKEDGKNEQTDGNGGSQSGSEGENQGGGEEEDNQGGNGGGDNQGGGDNTEHECKYDTGWTAGKSTHWHASLCSEHPKNKSEEAPHEYASLTGTCKVCDAPTPEIFSEGDKLPYFSFNTYANANKTYSTESAAGKVLVINFWYQSCQPCVLELPDLADVSQEYGDEIEVVALHAQNSEYQSAESFINKNGWADYKITFGLDANNVIYGKLSEATSYPVTVVVNPEGVIVEVIYGMVMGFDVANMKNYDHIHPAIEKALGRD